VTDCVSVFGQMWPEGCTPPAAGGTAPAPQGQQLTPAEILNLIQQGIQIGVQTGVGIATIVAVDQAGNLTTANGQTIPPQPIIIAPPAETGLLDNPMLIPLLLVGGVLVALAFRRAG
jgi:hypothetical protein